MKRTAAFVALLAGAFAAHAGDPLGFSIGARVTRVDSLANGLVTIRIDGFDAIANCTAPNPLDPITQVAWVIDTNSDGGQALYANVLFAASANSIVNLYGSGTCTNLTIPNPPMAQPISGRAEFLDRISTPSGN